VKAVSRISLSFFAAPLLLTLIALIAPFGTSDAVADESEEAERLEDAAEVFQAIQKIPDAEIPEPLLEDCRCIAVFPGVIKGAFGWGARRGHGVISCRDSSQGWSPPSFLTITGGSFGLQLGVEKTDVVLFFMSEKGARSLVESEFTLGGKGSVAAGPVGRSAEAGTDIKLNAEIYSYARSKGLFAGLSLEGSRINTDKKAIKRFYDEKVDPEEILFEHKVPSRPEAAQSFLAALPGGSP
jgi:lipid-binding SYLF domain-containing protein